MKPRFHLPDPAPRDSEIVKRASVLKLTVFRERDGDLSGSFEIEGSFDNFSDEESQDHVPEGLRFLRELMREFTRRRPEEGLLG